MSEDRCPIRLHVPDSIGMCRVCGEECFAPCPAEGETVNEDGYVESVSCGLYAGHEEHHDFEDEA